MVNCASLTGSAREILEKLRPFGKVINPRAIEKLLLVRASDPVSFGEVGGVSHVSSFLPPDTWWKERSSRRGKEQMRPRISGRAGGVAKRKSRDLSVGDNPRNPVRET